MTMSNKSRGDSPREDSPRMTSVRNTGSGDQKSEINVYSSSVSLEGMQSNSEEYAHFQQDELLKNLREVSANTMECLEPLTPQKAGLQRDSVINSLTPQTTSGPHRDSVIDSHTPQIAAAVTSITVAPSVTSAIQSRGSPQDILRNLNSPPTDAQLMEDFIKGCELHKKNYRSPYASPSMMSNSYLSASPSVMSSRCASNEPCSPAFTPHPPKGPHTPAFSPQPLNLPRTSNVNLAPSPPKTQKSPVTSADLRKRRSCVTIPNEEMTLPLPKGSRPASRRSYSRQSTVTQADIDAQRNFVPSPNDLIVQGCQISLHTPPEEANEDLVKTVKTPKEIKRVLETLKRINEEEDGDIVKLTYDLKEASLMLSDLQKEAKAVKAERMETLKVNKIEIPTGKNTKKIPKGRMKKEDSKEDNLPPVLHKSNAVKGARVCKKVPKEILSISTNYQQNNVKLLPKREELNMPLIGNQLDSNSATNTRRQNRQALFPDIGVTNKVIQKDAQVSYAPTFKKPGKVTKKPADLPSMKFSKIDLQRRRHLEN